MSTYNLSSYMEHGLFLKDLKKTHYDLIILEKKDNLLENIDNLKTDIIYLDQESNSLKNILQKNLKIKDNIIVILNTLSSESLNIVTHNTCKLTIVNLHIGIHGLGHKAYLDNNDIGKYIESGFDIYEPWDLDNLNRILETQTNKYIRLTDIDLAENMMHFEDMTVIDKDFFEAIDTISFTNYGYSGNNGLIIGTGSNIVNLFHALDIENQKGFGFDLFCISKLNFELKDMLKDRMKNHEKIIVVVDQKIDSNYQKWIKELFLQNNLGDKRLKFLYPDYDKLNTVLDEYKLEQVNFDGMGIWEKLEKIRLN